MTLRETILNIVNSSEGIKYNDLAMRVMAAENPHTFNKERLLAETEILLGQRQIVAIYYLIPQVGWRNIYFPKGTKFDVPKEAA